MTMEPDYLDLDAIHGVIDEAEVFVVRFAQIDQRLLVDTRPNDDGQPYIKLVRPAGSAEERYRFLQQERPGMALPEQITVFQWPRVVQAMKDLGVWEHIEKRVTAIGGDESAVHVEVAFSEAQRFERADIVAAIRGTEGYETIWERGQSA
jgi:hypothetical protein